MADNGAEIDKAHTFSLYLFRTCFHTFSHFLTPWIGLQYAICFDSFSIVSDFLGTLQPSKTTIQMTRGTQRVEESSSPRKVLHCYSSNSSRGRMRAEFWSSLTSLWGGETLGRWLLWGGETIHVVPWSLRVPRGTSKEESLASPRVKTSFVTPSVSSQSQWIERELAVNATVSWIVHSVSISAAIPDKP